MEILACSFILILFYLLLEKILYSRRLNKIPLRISVSGSRGKTSITRLLASVFRSNKFIVLAKTTGSEAKYILPDGSEETIKRYGKTSILEQKRFINKAVKLKANCIITEIMSIHPECHRIETDKLIKPGFTIISNIRPDHIHVAGESIEEISKYFLNDIYPSSKVLIHENVINEYLIRGVEKKNSELITGIKDSVNELKLSPAELKPHLSKNLDLVYSASKQFGIDDNTVKQGVLNARFDIGKLGINKFEKNNKRVFFVNSFSANDPESTSQIIQKVVGMLKIENPVIMGLLSLRSDRGERSWQWLRYLTTNGADRFDQLFLSGAHTKILKRKIRSSEILRSKNPEQITDHVISVSANNSVLFGLANFIGIGKNLAEYWNKKGIEV